MNETGKYVIKCTKLTRTPDNRDGVLIIDTIMEIEIAYIMTIYKDYKD